MKLGVRVELEIDLNSIVNSCDVLSHHVLIKPFNSEKKLLPSLMLATAVVYFGAATYFYLA